MVPTANERPSVKAVIMIDTEVPPTALAIRLFMSISGCVFRQAFKTRKALSALTAEKFEMFHTNLDLLICHIDN